jgi:hypothetical protein
MCIHLVVLLNLVAQISRKLICCGCFVVVVSILRMIVRGGGSQCINRGESVTRINGLGEMNAPLSKLGYTDSPVMFA